MILLTDDLWCVKNSDRRARKTAGDSDQEGAARYFLRAKHNIWCHNVYTDTT